MGRGKGGRGEAAPRASLNEGRPSGARWAIRRTAVLGPRHKERTWRAVREAFLARFGVARMVESTERAHEEAVAAARQRGVG